MHSLLDHITLNNYTEDTFKLDDHDIDIWFYNVEENIAPSKMQLGVLSNSEKVRANNYRWKKDMNKFIWSHACLRYLLGAYLKLQPDEIPIQITSEGKPYVQNDKGIQFNISHAGNWVLFALTRNRELGVDIEQIKKNYQVMDMARHFFSSQEVFMLQNAEELDQSALFYRLWTRKESYVKAIGKGISFPLTQFDVTRINNLVKSQVPVTSDHQNFSGFFGVDIRCPDGYYASIVAMGSDWKLRQKEITLVKFNQKT